MHKRFNTRIPKNGQIIINTSTILFISFYIYKKNKNNF